MLKYSPKKKNVSDVIILVLNFAYTSFCVIFNMCMFLYMYVRARAHTYTHTRARARAHRERERERENKRSTI